MSAIRLPASTAPLLEFCRPHPNRAERTLFSTYADLITFCAAYGWSEAAGITPPACRQFLETPNAIDLAIFRNQGLYPVALLLALASSTTPEAVIDENTVARTVEDYAAVGAAALQYLRTTSGGRDIHLVLGDLLIAEPAAEVRI